MKFEHVFMGYTTFVIVRYYWWIIRDEVKNRRQRCRRHSNKILVAIDLPPG
jgi:hypothetical protein